MSFWRRLTNSANDANCASHNLFRAQDIFWVEFLRDGGQRSHASHSAERINSGATDSDPRQRCTRADQSFNRSNDFVNFLPWQY